MPSVPPHVHLVNQDWLVQSQARQGDFFALPEPNHPLQKKEFFGLLGGKGVDSFGGEFLEMIGYFLFGGGERSDC